MNPLKIFLICIFIALFCYIVYVVIQQYRFNKYLNEKIRNYNNIPIGMSKMQALNLLGDNYTVSSLKDGTEKYEWKIKISGSSWGSSAKGISVRHYKSGYMVSMSLKFKNGVVVEKKGNNLDVGRSGEESVFNYNRINIGMSIAEVVALLGTGYTISVLKNGTEVYDWKVRGEGISRRTYSRGLSFGSSSGAITKQITVVFKDGKVIEKRGNNLEL